MRALRAAIVLGAFAVDRATKLWAMRELRGRAAIRIFPFFKFTYAQNTGASFGLGGGANGLFIGASSALIVALAWLMRRWPKDDFRLQTGGALVLAGAVGNLYDRVNYRFVVDFLDVGRISICNVADVCITAGAVLLFWGLEGRTA